MPLSKPQVETLLEQDPDKVCADIKDHLCVKIVAVANLPTRFGEFQIVGYYNNNDGKEHIALVRGDVYGEEEVPVRLHSECLTGDVLGSLRCDCRSQLIMALEAIGKLDKGILLYLRQEGRGIGLLNKVKAYQLQDFGLDTVEANLALGFEDDLRDYHIAAHMLKLLDVRSVMLMTNNPKKIDGLKEHGVNVVDRLPHQIQPNEHNEHYLRTKMEKSGHMLDEVMSSDPKDGA